VTLESLPQLPLPNIKDANVSLFAGRNNGLVLRGVDDARGSLVVAYKCYKFKKIVLDSDWTMTF
jgi:hypothetical protein